MSTASVSRRRRSLAPPPALIADTFTRTNSSTSLGRTETGQTWIANTANAIGVSSNKAYAPASGFAQRNVPTGLTNLVAEAEVTWKTGDNVGVCLRGKASGTDRIYLQIGTSLTIGKTVGGVTTTLETYAFTPVDGQTYKLCLVARDSQLIGYLDEVQRLTHVETDLITEQHAGITFFNGSAPPLSRVDNFNVYR